MSYPYVTIGRRSANHRSRQPSLIARVLYALVEWQSRAHERHALASLDDRALKDMGLNRAIASRESSQPFWRA